MLTSVPVTHQAEVEETLKRIQSQKGVQGIIIVNSEGKTGGNCRDFTCEVSSVIFHSTGSKAASQRQTQTEYMKVQDRI